MSTERPIRVVVIDDDPEALALVCVKLKGHPRIEIIGTGASGREAIQLANTLRPHVMVLDVMMPILNGLEAAARIAGVFPSIGLLMLTSDASPESIRAALRAGAKDYLDKSTELSRLAEAVLSAAEHGERAQPDKGLASVWAFYGAKGSSGSTTLAVGAAQELARAGRRVTLLDLDLLHGDCAFYLNVSAGQNNLFSQLSTLESMDRSVLAPFVKRYLPPGIEGAAGFDVLPSPSDYVFFERKAEENLIGLMDILITSNDFVIVDIPSGRIFEPNNVAVLDFVERLFFITNRDMASLRALLTFSRVLARTTIRIARFSILFGALREQSTFDYLEWLATTRLSTKSFMEVPLDSKACAKAVSSGLPVQLAEPDSALARFMKRLVEVGVRREGTEEPEAAPEASRGTLWQTFKRILGG